MIKTEQCSICLSSPPHIECAREDADMVCARLARYESAKLPQTWRQKCRQIDDAHITTNPDIREVMQEEINELRVYASRLATNLWLLNGIITRAARDAQKYVDAAERSVS